MKTQQNLHRHTQVGSLSASAFAGLLVLLAGAPVAALDIPVQQNTESSTASNSSGGVSSTSSSHSSGSSSRSSGGSGRSSGGRSGSGDGPRGGGNDNHRGERGNNEGRRDHGNGGRYEGGRRDGNYHHHDSGRRSRPVIRHRGGYWGTYGGWGYGTWGWGGWWPGWYPGWGGPTVIIETDGYGYRGSQSGALDLDLSPEKTQVFVDGNYIGVADDYDGFPTFLWLDSGTYDVAFYLPGYQTIVRQYTIRPGAIIDVEDRMVPGESIPPQELMRPRTTERRDARIQRNEEQEAEVERREREAEERGDRSEAQEGVGRLYLSLWPPDAAIYLDGHFLGTAEELGQLSAGLVVEPGEHSLEVVRPGYSTVRRTLKVPNGERIEVKFDLEKN